jgi:hypothetical protein
LKAKERATSEAVQADLDLLNARYLRLATYLQKHQMSTKENPALILISGQDGNYEVIKLDDIEQDLSSSDQYMQDLFSKDQVERAKAKEALVDLAQSLLEIASKKKLHGQ